MGETSRKEDFSTSRQTIAITSGKIIAMIATFAMPLFLTRFLSKSEYGLYMQFYVVVLFCTSFFSISIPSNLYYFYPTSSLKDKKSLVFQTMVLLLLLSVITILLLQIPILNNYLIGDGDLLLYNGYILIAIFLLMPVNIIEPLYVLKKDNITSVLFPPTQDILRIILVVIFVIIVPGIKSVLIAIVIAAAIVVLFIMTYTYKEIGTGYSIRELINMKLMKKQLSYSLPFGMAVSLNTFSRRFDKIICITFLSTSAFATYSIAFYGIPGIMQIYDSLSQVYLIRMTEMYQSNKIGRIADIYKSLVTKTYSFSIPAILIVTLYAEKIIVFLFTNKYIDAVPLFRIYLISFLFYMLGAGLILRASGKTKITFRSYLYSSIVTIPTTFFLVKYYGTWGAMIGALFSMILPKVVMLFQEMKLLNCNIINFFPWKKIISIIFISFITILPFLYIDYSFEYGIIFAGFLAFIYITIVSIIELKFELFVMEKALVYVKLNQAVKKVKSLIFTKKS